MKRDDRQQVKEVYDNETSLRIESKVETAIKGKCSLIHREIPFPGYVFEVKGPEDWRVATGYHSLRHEKWPIMLPLGHWETLIKSIPQSLTVYEPALADLIQTHHFIFYEPHELYRYRMPLSLVTYALRGNATSARLFWKKVIVENDKDSALKMLPEFERKFVERQWSYALWQKSRKPRKTVWKLGQKLTRPKNSPSPRRIWSSIDQEYIAHVQEAIEESSILPSASFIPGMPVLKSSSTDRERLQVIKMNRATAFLSHQKDMLVNRWMRGNQTVGKPWLSLYVDNTCFEAGSERKGATGVGEISSIVKTSFDTRAHVGVSLTVSSWPRIKSDKMSKERITWLIEDIVEFASSRGVPVLLPRSGYYGMEMLDHGVTFFGSLLSGAPEYRSPGVVKNPEDRYGKLAVYRAGELSYRETTDYLEVHGELPKVRGLPPRPDDSVLNDPLSWRLRFSKPMRLATHSREVKEISQAIRKGTRHPTLRYLEDMASSGKRYY